MRPTPWLLIAVLVILILLGIFIIVAAKKGKQRPPDYYAFFWMGLIWTIFGALFWRNGQFGFLGIGVVFLVLGLANRDKWEKNRIRWNDLTKGERQFKMGIMIFLGILLLLGMAVFYLVETKKL